MDNTQIMPDEPLRSQMQILERIIVLETKLASTIDKLENVVDNVGRSQKHYYDIFSGSGTAPGLVSRVITLEEFKRSAQWAIGVLYTAVIGGAAALILRVI